MQVCLTGSADPGSRRDQICSDYPTDPLQSHQNRKHMVRAFTDVILMSIEKLFGASESGFHFFGTRHSELGSNKGHPKTLVTLVSGISRLMIDTIALLPALSPECPREGVIPPVKT